MALKVCNLEYKYPGNSENTIKNINFEINKGEIFGFLGPSGAGKSTTQKIVTGVLKEYSGNVNILGNEAKTIKSRFYERIGVAFEFPNHYNKFTALENLDFFKSLYSSNTEDSYKLLEMVGLEADAKTRVSGFSKGMKVRLNFCRALLNKPEMIFLDEPTSGLDPVNAKILKNIILQKKSEGCTIFLTTHNMTLADDICDRVAFMVNGYIKTIEIPKKLKKNYGQKILRVEYENNDSCETRDFVPDRLAENIEFMKLLKSNKILTMNTLEATLEDVFLAVTGSKLT